MKSLFSVLSALALTAATAYAESGPLKFRFHPPDSIDFVTTTSTIRTRYNDTTIVGADTSKTGARMKIRHKGSGYTVTSIPVSMAPHGQDPAKRDLMEQLTEGTRIVLALDSTGTATGVSGYEALFSKIDSLLDSAKAAVVKKVVRPEMLAAKDKNDWNSRMSRLIGQPVVIGNLEHENAQFTLPDKKQLPLFVTHQITDTFRVADKLCARVVTISDSDPAHLAKLLQKRVMDVATMLNLTDNELTALMNASTGYFARSELVVEVNTMLVHSENANREIRFAVGSSSVNPTVGNRMTELTRKEFEYTSK